jgi:hypothetical protein
MKTKWVSRLWVVVIGVLAACQAAPTPVAPSATSAATPRPPTNTPAAATPVGTWIRLTPDSGPPGTVIHIDGYLPGGPDAAGAADNQTLLHTTVCWDGCLTGFTAVDSPVEWSADQPGQFSTQFTAPSLPWLGPDGPVPGVAAVYRVGVQCLGPLVTGCALQEAQAEAEFHLTDSSPARCLTGQPCVELGLAPSQARPGDKVSVSGWAPVFETIDGQAFGYTLSLQIGGTEPALVPVGQIDQGVDGNLSGQFVVPQSAPGGGPLTTGAYAILLQASTPQSLASGLGPQTLAQANLTFGQGQAWQSLPAGAPLWLAASADLTEPGLFADPQEPNHLAYCAPNTIRVSLDAGNSWTNVPISGAVHAIEQAGYQVMSGGTLGGQPACLSVTLDAAHPSSLFAVFTTAEAQMGAPPEYLWGLATADSGNTWTLIPRPGPDYDFPFGGITMAGPGKVAALYSPAGTPTPPLVALVTQDGGRTWSAGQVGCPESGPCLRWGPAPGSISGMGAPRPQTLLMSPDSGRSWEATDVTIDLHAFVAGQAAGYQAGQVLVVAGLESFPARWSADGGRTWQTLSLPQLPGNDVASTNFSGLQILPTGTLIAQSDQGAWAVLIPGASSWCSLSAVGLPDRPARLVSAGGSLWWLDDATGQPGHAPASDFSCSP